jgi:hypothetical protein
MLVSKIADCDRPTKLLPPASVTINYLLAHTSN